MMDKHPRPRTMTRIFVYSYHDATDSVGLKTLETCPVCNIVFPDTMTPLEINEHVNTHLDNVCPMCGSTFDVGGKVEDFQAHVNQHFTD